MRFVIAGLVSVAVLAFSGVGFIAWDFGDRFAAGGFWTAGLMGFGLVAVLLDTRRPL